MPLQTVSGDWINARLADAGVIPVQVDPHYRGARIIIATFEETRRALNALGRVWDAVKIRKPGKHQGMYSVFR
jgi:hypothetical protein